MYPRRSRRRGVGSRGKRGRPLECVGDAVCFQESITHLLLRDFQCIQHHPNAVAHGRAEQTHFPRRLCCRRLVQVELDHRILHAFAYEVGLPLTDSLVMLGAFSHTQTIGSLVHLAREHQAAPQRRPVTQHHPSAKRTHFPYRRCQASSSGSGSSHP